MAKKAKKAKTDEASKPAGSQSSFTAENGQDVQENPPSMQIMAQYVKDLSFENPLAPESLMQPEAQPQVDIGVNVNAQKREPDAFDVDLHLEAKATHEGKTIFAVELVYGGVFRVENVPEEMLQAIILIECPRMLFPYARAILSEAIRDGGFPPLMLDPIDFAALYQQRMMQEQQAQA